MGALRLWMWELRAAVIEKGDWGWEDDEHKRNCCPVTNHLEVALGKKEVPFAVNAVSSMVMGLEHVEMLQDIENP